MINVHGFAAMRSPACFFYRLYSPLDYLNEVAKKGEIKCTLSETINDERVDQCDILIFQRSSVPKDKELIDRAIRRGKKVIYELDDDVLHLHLQNPHYKYYSNPEVRDTVKYFLSAAHQVVASTKPVYDFCTEYNENVRVIPNAIDFRIINPRVKNNKKIVVGYQGAIEHKSELKLIAKCVETLTSAKYRDKVIVKMFGFKYPRCEFIRFFPFEYFHEALRLADFDIGLAPVALNKFNEGKSNLKWLEYGAFETVTIASDIFPYSNSIKNGVDGYIVKDSRDWISHVDFLIEKPEVLQSVQHLVRERIEKEFNVKDTCLLWYNLFTELLGK